MKLYFNLLYKYLSQSVNIFVKDVNFQLQNLPYWKCLPISITIYFNGMNNILDHLKTAVTHMLRYIAFSVHCRSFLQIPCKNILINPLTV